MSRILFITCRNIINTCGELRLIKNRAQALYKHYDIQTDFMVFTHKEEVTPEKINAGGKIDVYRYNLFNLFQRKRVFDGFCKDIEARLVSTQYDIVVISGSQILNCVDTVKNVGGPFRLFADIHGAFEELIEFTGNTVLKTIARRFLYKKVKKLEAKYFPIVDNFFVVSEGLKKYLISEYKLEGARIHIVPCAIEQTSLDTQVLFHHRKISRENYGVLDDERLFIYSGGVSKWQCIEETVEIFKQISDSANCKCKMLILSGDKEYISKFKSDIIMVDSLKSEDVPKVLPAGDFAFLLRGNYITNHVAYPNKFLEYIMAGLKVITTPYVNDIAEAVINHELGYVLSSEHFEKKIVRYIEHANIFGADIDQRQLLLDEVCFENRLSFIKHMKVNNEKYFSNC